MHYFKTEEQENRETEILNEILSILADKNCTIAEGNEILRMAKDSLEACAIVQKIPKAFSSTQKQENHQELN